MTNQKLGDHINLDVKCLSAKKCLSVSIKSASVIAHCPFQSANYIAHRPVAHVLHT